MRSMYGAWRMKREAIYTPFFFFTQAFFGEDLERREERTGRKKEERKRRIVKLFCRFGIAFGQLGVAFIYTHMHKRTY